MRIDDQNMPVLWEQHKSAFVAAMIKEGLIHDDLFTQASWDLISHVDPGEQLRTLFTGYLLGARNAPQQPLCKNLGTECGMCAVCDPDAYAEARAVVSSVSNAELDAASQHNPPPTMVDVMKATDTFYGQPIMRGHAPIVELESLGECEGDTCGSRLRAGVNEFCAGKLERVGDRNCSCHISPPCHNCVDAVFECDECGRRTDGDSFDEARRNGGDR